MKQESCAKSERKLAKTLADQIQEVALIMEILGKLYLKIQKQDLNRSFNISEKVWLSDFQSDNKNCPAELRSLILNTFQRKKKAILIPRRKKNKLIKFRTIKLKLHL